MSSLPTFPVTTVGSWPRSPGLLRALRERRRGTISADQFREVARAGVRESLRAQVEAGVDLVTDGEQQRDNFYSFVAEKLDGVRLMTLAEMLDLVEDKEGFRQLLDTLDVPAFSISNPTCVGEIRLREPLAVNDLHYLRTLTDRPIKVTLPGPYLLTRAMWVPEATREAYPDKEALGARVVEILRGEIEQLARAGADFIQLDEPVLTELVFSQGQTRTFMCAALAARKDPQEELEFAVSMIGRVLEGAGEVRTGLHVCRGNWSRDESTLLSGTYAPLAPWFERMPVRQLVLEYATSRAGEVVSPGGKELGLGVVNPRSDEIEAPAQICERVRAAMRHVPAERLFLNPDCGFGTFAARPMNTPDVAARKLASMVAAARILREGSAST
ncbi:MAG TPA: cobalamin-independent methionine synthase II family protein [Candidatus Eisenbacteria bacterium]|nr:cobalamin-independent methionine synthase II family protein [Candidatus Eisenbacteria bacterium]